jgi:hypothetical protein
MDLLELSTDISTCLCYMTFADIVCGMPLRPACQKVHVVALELRHYAKNLDYILLACGLQWCDLD